MKIDLDIEKDKEIRAEVKKLICSQVKSITREEFAKEIREELKCKVATVEINKYDLQKYIAVAIKNSIPRLSESIMVETVERLVTVLTPTIELDLIKEARRLIGQDAYNILAKGIIEKIEKLPVGIIIGE